MKSGQKVKCIDAKSAYGYLTMGKTYQVELVGLMVISLVGIALTWNKDRFVIISCPCLIQNCLTHRAKT